HRKFYRRQYGKIQSRLRRTGENQTRYNHAERHSARAGRSARAHGRLWADDAGLRRAVSSHGLSRFVSVRDRRNVAGFRGGNRHGVLPARGAPLSRSDRRGAAAGPVDGRDGYEHDARSDDGFSDERARPGGDWESRRVDGAAWRVPG